MTATPARVDCGHVDVRLGVVGGGGARHHVECGLGHVGVRVGRGLVAVEAPLHRRHVDDELEARRVAA
eukprot:5616853-Prymnesium_polylepis.1